MECDGSRCRLNRGGAERSNQGARLGGNNHKRSSHVELVGEDTNMKKAHRIDRLRPDGQPVRNGRLGPGDAQQREAEGLPDLRLEHGSCRLRPAGRAGQLDRPRRRFLPRHRGGDLRRPDQGPLHPARRQGPLHGAPVGRSRRPRPQLDRDDVARHAARPRFPGHQLLRRPGLHGPQEARRRLRQGAERRLDLHPAGHHDRAQPRRLLPRQQHEVRSRGLRDLGRDLQGL